mgnify:CR=1 FL=1
MNPTNAMKLVQLAIGKMPFVKIFRNNTGTGWVGKSRRIPNSTDVVIEDARPLHAGLCSGSSDLIGWTSVIITPEHVGKRIAIFTALEIKSGSGRASPDQLNFINVVKDSGGLGAIIRSPEEAVRFISDHAK